MKAIINFIIFSTLFCLNATAQKPSKQECDFFGPLHFKNGKATVIVKAMYIGINRSPEYNSFKDVEKKNILDSKKYFRLDKIKGEGYMDSGTELQFAPENCSKTYSAVIAQRVNTSHIKSGWTIYLTCTVYKDIPNYKDPFFVIDNITYKKDDIPKPQNTKPLIYFHWDIDKLSGTDGYTCFSDEDHINKFEFLMITPKDSAIVQTSDHKFHYFIRTKRSVINTGYIDSYKNNNDFLQLEINRVIDNTGGEQLKQGRVTLSINNIKNSFAVMGQTYKQ